MKCIICKKGVTRQGTTTVTLERDCLTMVVKGVPAEVCPSAKRPTSMRRSRPSCSGAQKSPGKMQVEIRQYAAA